MEQVRNFIDLVAQGNNIDAKSALEDLISSRAFDSLESKKREMASSIFGGVNEAKEIKEESESEHYKAGHDYASDHAQDSGFKVTARARKKEMLADNPHKKGTPEHSDWHRGAKDGHQMALDNM
jgi:hypothetical protein